jgi:hypothetical protein
MGQEVVYCFKCQKRIISADFAKGQAFQVENNFCCSSCAVTVLETLPPKAKEALLAKMFKATHDRQSASSAAVKASPSAASSTGRIPHATPRPMKVAGEPSSGPLIAGIVGAIVAVVIVVIFLSSGSTPPPPPVTVPPRPPPPPVVKVDPGPSAEEKRAKDAMKAAREFAIANPKDVDGQLRLWKLAQLEAERTGYESETKREVEKAEARIKDAVAQEFADLERDGRALATRKDFKAASELVDRARGKRSGDWNTRIEGLRREMDDAAAKAFGELKDKATAARLRGTKTDVDAAKAEVAKWGIPEYVADLDAALEQAGWRPIFDGKTPNFLVREAQNFWLVQDGALIRDLSKGDQAAQTNTDFEDGVFRFRFTIQNGSNVYFAVRQAGGGQTRVIFYKPELDALPSGIHEVLITCRGTDVSATLDGNPVKVTVEGKPHPRGRIQFNSAGGTFRLLSVDMRDLP